MAGTGIGLVSQWQSQFEGRLVTPPDDAYEESRRIWNGMIDNRPTLIARCASPSDVRAAVKLAHAEQMPVSVRSGGHGVAGTAVCHGGLMIDLSTMKDIRVDPVSR
jgi:FAD/FMN-containing dehydrogenase